MIALILCLILLPASLSFSADDSTLETVHRTFRYLHAHPELSNQEFHTSKLIRDSLEAAGFTEFADAPSTATEVIAVLRTGRPGPVTCLRAELDALGGTQETTGLDYASTVDGVMHACGHDAHAAMLLGAALELKQDTTLKGTLVFLWQPAEEKRGGADDIVNDGTLRELGVERIFAQHVTTGLPVGDVTLTPGAFMAGSNYFRGTVHGRGSHGAYPHEGDNVPVALGAMIEGLPSLPALKMNAVTEPCVISVAWVSAGDESTWNRIPGSARFAGTLRSFLDIDAPLQSGKSISEIVQTYVNGLACAHGCTIEFELFRGAPPVVNDSALAASVVPQLQAEWTHGSITTGQRQMTSEDFAYYTSEFPCLYFRLGIAKDGMGEAGIHTGDFTIHPDALDVGLDLLLKLAHLD